MEQLRLHQLLAVPDRLAWTACERQQRVTIVDERGDGPQQVYLFPARSGAGRSDRPKAVDAPPRGLAGHAADPRRHAAQLGVSGHWLERQREHPLQPGAPALACRLDRRSASVGVRLAVLEEDRRARPRGPVDLALARRALILVRRALHVVPDAWPVANPDGDAPSEPPDEQPPHK